MPKVKFLQDFQGAETRNAFYKKDDEVDLPDSMADVLVKDGRAVVLYGSIHDSTPQFEKADIPQPEPQPKFKRGKK